MTEDSEVMCFPALQAAIIQIVVCISSALILYPMWPSYKLGLDMIEMNGLMTFHDDLMNKSASEQMPTCYFLVEKGAFLNNC